MNQARITSTPNAIRFGRDPKRSSSKEFRDTPNDIPEFEDWPLRTYPKEPNSLALAAIIRPRFAVFVVPAGFPAVRLIAARLALVIAWFAVFIFVSAPFVILVSTAFMVAGFIAISAVGFVGRAAICVAISSSGCLARGATRRFPGSTACAITSRRAAQNATLAAPLIPPFIIFRFFLFWLVAENRPYYCV
jgi:hypothetical protein